MTFTFEQWASQYKDLVGTQKIIEGSASNNMEAQRKAEDLAVKIVTDKKLGDIVTAVLDTDERKEEFKRDSRQVRDTLLKYVELTSHAVADMYQLAKDTIFDSIPIDKLAKKYWEINPAQIEGNNSHNKIAEPHSLGRTIESLLKVEDGKEPDMGKITKLTKIIVDKQAAEFVENSDNKLFKADPQKYFKIIKEWAYTALVRSPKLIVAYLSKKKDDFKKQVETALPDDSARGNYALNNLRVAEEKSQFGYLGMLAS